MGKATLILLVACSVQVINSESYGRNVKASPVELVAPSKKIQQTVNELNKTLQDAYIVTGSYMGESLEFVWVEITEAKQKVDIEHDLAEILIQEKQRSSAELGIEVDTCVKDATMALWTISAENLLLFTNVQPHLSLAREQMENLKHMQVNVNKIGAKCKWMYPPTYHTNELATCIATEAVHLKDKIADLCEGIIDSMNKARRSPAETKNKLIFGIFRAIGEMMFCITKANEKSKGSSNNCTFKIC